MQFSMSVPILAVFLAFMGPAGAAQASPPQAPKTENVIVDLYGNPLPPGAIARLGTVRYRIDSVFMSPASGFLSDCKTVVTGAPGRRVV